MFEVEMKIPFHLEVGHYMPTFPENHPNRRMHGHSFEGEVILAGKVSEETGMLVDYEEARKVIHTVCQDYDHKLLNDIPGLEVPTSENLARALYHAVKKKLDATTGIILFRRTVGLTIRYPLP